MQNRLAISGFLLAALTTACDGSSHPKTGSDGSALSGGAAGAGNDAAHAPASAGGTSHADTATAGSAGSGGGGSSGGRTVVSTGGSGAAGGATLSASGGGEGRDGPPAEGGTSPAGGTGGSAQATAAAGASSAAGSSGSAGTTAAAGTSGSAGRTATAGTSGSAGRTATAGTSGSAGNSGSGGSTGIAAPADNVVAAAVDFGLPNIGYLNGLFVSVAVCVPGSSQCQTIDHVLVDTGSTGLRVLKSALTLSLPVWTNSSGVALAECTQFVSGFTWGTLHGADIKIAGEQANGLAIQAIGESTYPVPSGCTGSDNSTVDTLRANGIIGVGSFLQDCGAACATTPGPRSSNPGTYYACTSANKGGCVVAAVPVDKQVTNPVALFNQDNNGTIIQLPTIPSAGTTQVSGALIFGIGTRDNNGLGQATVLPLDNSALLLTTYPANGSTSFAFIDSGSNALYFANAGSTIIPTCTTYPGFYCPRSTLSLSATNKGATGAVSLTVNFSIANAETLFARQNNVAYSNLGGTAAAGGYFDWGLPFYFGKSVYASIEGQSTPVGKQLFVAF